MPAILLDLNIPPDALLAYYRGEVRTIRLRAVNGQSVQFPASALRKHVAPEGIYGRYWLEFDANNKFIGLEPAVE